MPELPEVETVVRGLARALIGARLIKAEAHRANLRFPIPKRLAAEVKGSRVLEIKRRAKYILIKLDNKKTLILHLGMSGRMVITSQMKDPEKHDHLVFAFDNGLYVHFNDPRRFGMCDLVLTKDLPNYKLLKHLGIEPLEGELTPSYLSRKLAGKKTSIKIALLDQRILVGVGNIYASEALYKAGISPKRLAGRCTKEQIVLLVPALQKVLRAAIKAGGSSLRDYVQSSGELGYFQHQFAVYDRAGERCPDCICDLDKTGGIKRIVQGGRSSFYCKTKQI